MTGDLETVSALVIHEFDTVGQELVSASFTDIESLVWGPQYETTIHPVYELDETGHEVNDWHYDDLQDALDHLTNNYPGCVWEPLPDDRDKALRLIQQRLAHPPS